MNQFTSADGIEFLRSAAALQVPDMTRAIADAAAGDDAEENVAGIARQRFRARNGAPRDPEARAVLSARLGATRQRIARREARLRQTPETRTVARPGFNPTPRMQRFMGWTMFVVALTMLTPIPLMVAIGMAEGAMTLSAFIDRPWLATFYGFAPWGAVAALKLIRHALACERHKAQVDAGLALATLAVFGVWIVTYSTTFLADTSLGMEAAFDATASMGTFYTVQLLLEVTAGYCAWTFAERLLAHGATQEVIVSPASRALFDAQERDLEREERQASLLDAIEYDLARRDAAEADFVGTSLARLAGYQARMQGLSDAAATEARAGLRADFIETFGTSAKEDIPHDAFQS